MLPDRSTHWDLCLDLGEALATWQMLADPALLVPCHAAITISLRRIPDHRRAYLDYEGPVSGNRGHVQRVDVGTWEPILIEPDHWVVRLSGSWLIGSFEWSSTGDPGGRWEMRRSTWLIEADRSTSS